MRDASDMPELQKNDSGGGLNGADHLAPACDPRRGLAAGYARRSLQASEHIFPAKTERQAPSFAQRPYRYRRRGTYRSRQDPVARNDPSKRFDISRRPRHGNVLQARLGPGRRDQPDLPPGCGGTADRRQERRRRGADAVRPLAGRALSQDRAHRRKRGAQGTAGIAIRYRPGEETRGLITGGKYAITGRAEVAPPSRPGNFTCPIPPCRQTMSP